ncbi:MAG: TIGR03668 family PPOX class F420-dependent oxidoreductase [Haloferacaceae archaeon]
MFSTAERAYLETARVGRLATADERGRPNVVPFCFALHDGTLVSAIDEKPQRRDPASLRRARDVRANPYVAAVVDEYSEDWSELRWVQVRGRATLVDPEDDSHGAGVDALREKYDQYRTHAIEDRPLVRVRPGHVLSWGLD